MQIKYPVCIYTFVLVRQGDGGERKQSIIIQIESSPGCKADVIVDRGVNGKLSQETTEMTTGASLISLQPYQAPCPRYKCRLSPRDWDRKPSRASCQAVINIDLEFYKRLFLYFEV